MNRFFVILKKNLSTMSLSSVARRMVASKAGGAASKISPVTARVWVNKDTKVICQGITGAGVFF
jgi:hypothetical protein